MRLRVRHNVVWLSLLALLSWGCGGGSQDGSSSADDTTETTDVAADSAADDSGTAADDGGNSGDAGQTFQADAVQSNADAAGGAGNDGGGQGGAGTDGAAGSGDAGAAGSSDTGSAGGADATSGPKVCTYNATTGPTGSECGSGKTCLVGVGKCTGLVIGQCLPTPNVCPAVVAEVCGCDGKTYTSLCDAQVAGAIVKTGGKCAKPDVLCGGKYGKSCVAGEICDPTCSINGIGICRPAPGKACPNGGSPECGCDGKTYPSGCFRRQASVGLAHLGKCPTGNTAVTCKIGPVKPVLCAQGYYCKINTAGDCSGKGKCTPIPPVCDGTQKPLCGCDKNTYSNACKLAQAGFSPQSTDPCK
ncbi:MAG: hypothetical protein KC502_14935 [Myxococcales bacterium]|nr:hypothetical protein [Myxococcales bacterium]